MIIPFLAGAAAWSFAEYALHNWYGHKAKGRNEFSREHLTHHARQGYFTPHAKKARAALPALGLVGLAAGAPFALGFGLGYVGYEWLHRRLHTHPPRNAYGAWARRHHFYHHFGNPKYNHGVTSPLWDWVFGTYARPGTIKVPPRLAMDWLCDEGRVKPEFAGDYELGGAAARSGGP